MTKRESTDFSKGLNTGCGVIVALAFATFLALAIPVGCMIGVHQIGASAHGGGR